MPRSFPNISRPLDGLCLLTGIQPGAQRVKPFIHRLKARTASGLSASICSPAELLPHTLDLQLSRVSKHISPWIGRKLGELEVTQGYEAVTPPTSEGSLTHPWACGSDALPSTPTSSLPSVGPVLLFTLILSLCSLTVPCVGQSAWLHLRAWPDPVFEGDALTLRCHASANKVLSQVKFYKDGRLLQTPKTRWSLSVGTATLESSGQYSCSGKVAYVPYLGRQTSELVKVQVQEPFPPPVLSAVPSPELREGSPLTLRCQTKLHPQKSASSLLFSFHRDASTLRDWGPHPEFYLPGAQERDSGLYWCQATLEGGVAQKQSPQLEVRVQVPVSQPLLTLRPGPTGLAVGAMVELLCEAQKGSPPISYLFYLDGKILGNISSPYGRATCFPVTVTSEQDARYSCRAENYVSGETSEPKILSLDALMVTPTWGWSAPSSPHWLVAGLSASLLGVLVIATALLACFRPWRKAGQ
ncbi:Fc receptor-like protein 6 [Herpailurus yagouaroundi]|uniref:Fc receptor-like protein 6 n=1 Tax=Herpailurus yagouaroundi TaxID=1608482 RepID=UPI001AD6FCC1|nr:Fc receptor-like protein 6 [Puma yagouaroundi]